MWNTAAHKLAGEEDWTTKTRRLGGGREQEEFGRAQLENIKLPFEHKDWKVVRGCERPTWEIRRDSKTVVTWANGASHW